MRKSIYFIMAILLFASCEKELETNQQEELSGISVKGKMAKVNICHKGKIISINGNALDSHLNHGDISLIDLDGDGYVEVDNECGIPSGDCDDTNANVNPGVEEICDNGIDDDCDGEIDEECVPEIGDIFQGGFVFYIFQIGDEDYVDGETHGLIAAPTNLSTRIRWYNGSYIETLATATAIGTGQANTLAIIDAQGPGSYAASSCNDLVLNSFSDWFLPSALELNKMYLNIGPGASGANENIGGFDTSDAYWSSSDSGSFDNCCAALVYFDVGDYDVTWEKHSEELVRAIRAF